MDYTEGLDFLIHELNPATAIPDSESAKWQLFRALVNVREPSRVSERFLTEQDTLLRRMTAEKHITDINSLTPIRNRMYLWQGDITTLRVGAIVNAANSGMLGCFCPNHSCIDNAIHTFAGVQLREECAELMRAQGYPEPTGLAKITAAYYLPCDWVLHTVGPVVRGALTETDCKLLANCYRSCLTLAQEKQIESVAFCCISTGEFHFPNQAAAEIAVQVVTEFLAENEYPLRVVFNVFKETDYAIYKELLG